MKKKNLKSTLEKVLLKFGGSVATLALLVTAFNVNTACMYVIHQEKIPQSAKKMRKF